MNNEPGAIMIRAKRFAAMAFGLALAANAWAQNTIRIGELNSYKVFPAFLEPYKKGMELAVEQVNAAGGVLGRQIELLSHHDGGTPGEAGRVAEARGTRAKARHVTGP